MDQAMANREILTDNMSLTGDNHDPVSFPDHYRQHPSGIECIDITKHMSFTVGNAIKYLWRAGLKDSDATVQDLQKAVWYINDEIKRLENITNRDKEQSQ